MNHCRVGLWVDNQGSIPDCYLELRTNASLSVEQAIALTMYVHQRTTIRRAEVQVLGSSSSQTFERFFVTLYASLMELYCVNPS